jgi:hypothetical protein
MNTAMRFRSLSLWERARVRVSAKAEALTPTLSQWEREQEGRP